MDAITKAKSQLIMSFPFWGRLAFQPQYIEDPNVKTATTDGVSIRYNPAYVDSLSNAEVQGLVAHEVGHSAFGHVFRLACHDPVEFNIAGDYALNGILIAAGITLPPGALYDPQYDGMGAEEIYARRQRDKSPENDDDEQQPGGDDDTAGENQDDDQTDTENDDSDDGDDDDQDDDAGNEQQPGGGDGEGQDDDQTDDSHDFGGCGEFTEPGHGASEFMSPADKAELENEWRIATEQAAQVEKACGDMGEDLKRQIDKLRQPIVDWRAVTSEFVDSCVQRRHSWTRPNRRFIGSGVYLPSLIPDGVGHMVLVLDTSGSRSDDDLAQDASEVFDIFTAANPEKLTVIYCHHRVTNTETFTPDDPPDKLHPVGTGGTKFSPAFDWVDENLEDDPVCLIYLTDLESSDWPEEQDYPVLWVSYSVDPDKVAPMGETIHMGSIN